MKLWITRFAAGVLATATLGLTACKKDEVQATLTPTNSATLTASTTSLTLTQANAAQNAITFNFTPIQFAWSNAEHTYNPSVTYTLQVANKGTNFANPISIDLGAGPTKTFTVADFNAQLLAGGFPYNVATASDIRLKATYAANSPMYSGTLPLTATTYCAQPAASSAWSIIGDAAKGWSTDVIMTYDCASNSYTYTGPFVVGPYKFRYGGDVGNWKANLGGTSSTGGALTQNGDNLQISRNGTYTVTLKPASFNSDGTVASGSTFTIK